MLQWIATVPPFDLALSRYRDVEIRYSNFTAGSTGGMYSTVHLPPVHPAVPTFRRMNWRQDDIFAKKKFRHIFLINREKNNIKIKKTPRQQLVVQLQELSRRGPGEQLCLFIFVKL